MSDKHNHPQLIYITDSKVLSSEHGGKPAHTIHHNVVNPVLQELKGYMNFYVFDCSHPQVKQLRKAKHPNYEKFMAGTCRKENKDGNPMLGIYK